MHLRVKLLVVAVQAVDVTLDLSASATHLEADNALVDTVVQLIERLDTHVLQRVLDTGNKVGDELGDGATVQDGASDTLGDQDARVLREVASSTSIAGLVGLGVLAVTAGLLVLHGGDTAHTTVRLDKLTLVANEVLAGGLGGTGEETTHHDSAGAKGQTLDDVTDVLDTTVGNARNAEASSKRRDAADGSSLRTADSHDLLGNASTTGTHANSQAIGTSSNKQSSLLLGDNVTSDNVDLRELLLDVLEHVELVHAAAVAGIQDNNVQTSLNEQLEAVLILLTGTDSGSTDKLLGVGELRSQRVVEVLHEIRAGKEGDKVARGINDGQLALLGAAKHLVGLGEGSTSRGSDQVSGHDGSDRLIKVLVELDVPGSNHANQLGAKGSVLCHQDLVSIQAR